MAIVKKIELTDSYPSKPETSVNMECLYNENIFIMRTRGSENRAKLDKISQIIQLDKKIAQELYELLDEFINFIPGQSRNKLR